MFIFSSSIYRVTLLCTWPCNLVKIMYSNCSLTFIVSIYIIIHTTLFLFNCKNIKCIKYFFKIKFIYIIIHKNDQRLNYFRVSLNKIIVYSVVAYKLLQIWIATGICCCYIISIYLGREVFLFLYETYFIIILHINWVKL